MEKSNNILNPESWIQIYSDEFFGYAMSKTSNSELAEDIVQETFLAGLKSAANFKGNSSERTWLYAILKNKIADHYKKASTKYEISDSRISKENESSLNNYFNEDGEWRDNASPKDWGTELNSILENKELGLVLQKCIGKLPDNQKSLIMLKMVEEKETEKVCKDLNITPTNFWVIMHRAKLQLRDCLEKNWFKA